MFLTPISVFLVRSNPCGPLMSPWSTSPNLKFQFQGPVLRWLTSSQFHASKKPVKTGFVHQALGERLWCR